MNIPEYIDSIDSLDFRKMPSTPLFVEQKITPDVFSSVCEIISKFTQDNHSKLFSYTDIFTSEICNEIFALVYGKPDTGASQHEYDKLAGQQPINVLCVTGIIEEVKIRKRSKFFQIKNRELLDYLSLSTIISLDFLFYFWKRLAKDSGFGDDLDILINKLEYSNDLKVSKAAMSHFQENIFYPFLSKYTGKGKLDPKTKKISRDRGRVIPKFINVFSVKLRLRGRIRGYCSKEIISLPDIIYNKKNWKDIAQGKKKNWSREEFSNKESDLSGEIRGQAEFNKIKRKIFELCNGKSENNDRENAHNAHHIFRKESHPEYYIFQENIIYISGSEHSEVHARSTKTIDSQLTCEFLISKLNSIKNDTSGFYDINRFKDILKSGFHQSLDEINIDISSQNEEDLKESIINLQEYYKNNGISVIPE
jgi:hypothetical protein